MGHRNSCCQENTQQLLCMCDCKYCLLLAERFPSQAAFEPSPEIPEEPAKEVVEAATFILKIEIVECALIFDAKKQKRTS